MDVHPTKNVSIGIDPYPYDQPSIVGFYSNDHIISHPMRYQTSPPNEGIFRMNESALNQGVVWRLFYIEGRG